MIFHLMFGTHNLEASRQLYDAVLDALCALVSSYFGISGLGR